MQSSTEAPALDEVPCIDLFLVKCGIMIFHFFFSFFYQLDCVMCSHQKCPCEHSNFSRQLINLYCLKKSSQVEGTKSDYDILCVFAPLCARVCVCVNSVHGSLSCAFYYTYTERRHFRSKKIKSLFKIPKTTRDEK